MRCRTDQESGIAAVMQRKGEKMQHIKNIDHETVLSLTELVDAQPGQIVSKTLAQNDYVSVTLFAFDKGEEISTQDRKSVV